jgi:hypothetical protein
MSTKFTKLVAAAGALALTAFAGEAWALEGNTPYLPGVSVGIPIGALPPPGFYASDDNVIISGSLKNNSGNDAHLAPGVGLNANAYLNIPSILWVPTWQPLGFMNATIAFDAVEPYVQQSFNLNIPATAAAFFNTIIGANVSWNYHPFFFKVGLGFYLPDGNWQDGIANNTWTFEPDFAVTYLNNGWNFTAHAIIDFQTEDDRGHFAGIPAHYQSGDIFFLDLTAGKSIGKWTFGVGGNYTRQLNNDHISNTLACAVFGLPGTSCDTPAIAGIQGKGNVQNRVLVGPFLGYNFGPAEINAKVLYTVHAENGFQSSFYHIGFSFPF